MNHYIKTDTIVAYSHDGALTCVDCVAHSYYAPGCGRERNAEEALDMLAWSLGINRNDESSYGDTFYKVVFVDQVSSDDCCDICLENIMDTI